MKKVLLIAAFFLPVISFAQGIPGNFPGVATNTPVVEKPLFVPLIDFVPSDADLYLLTDIEDFDSKGIYVQHTFGAVDMKGLDGRFEKAYKGLRVAPGATIITGYGGEITLQFGDRMIIRFDERTELKVPAIKSGDTSFYSRIKLDRGSLRIKVLDGDTNNDVEVKLPNLTAAVIGTDFGVGHNVLSGTSTAEVYEGSLGIMSKKTGEQQSIESTYGNVIPHLEVGNDGISVINTIDTLSDGEGDSGRVSGIGAEIGLALMVVLAILLVGGGGAAAVKAGGGGGGRK